MKKEDIARLIDHTLLRPDAAVEDLIKLCGEAEKFNFASVCVNPLNVRFCVELLKGTGIPVCTVAGFPLGASRSEVKSLETSLAVNDGAEEVDMVINIGALKMGEDGLVVEDIAAVVKAAEGNVVKVIIEACLLNREEKIRACKLAEEAGAHFVKTSTGFSLTGAKVEDVRLMRRTVGNSMGVKAAGGIKDFETAVKMVSAGANRIGASASVKIVS